jgi:cytoskeleton protein RodZ
LTYNYEMVQSVGEQLKQARLARGLTLDQAAGTTRIRRHYLEALERDDRGSLPSAVQGRGFLRLYAGYLGLPVEQLVDLWEGRWVPEPLVPVSRPEPVEEPSAQPKAGEPLPAAPESPAQPMTLSTETALVAAAAPEPSPKPAPAAGSSQAFFTEVGHRLRRQRESLSLSMTEVERYTRLRQHYLHAMETGQLEELPSMVQGRGMLSNYATFLNLDSEAILLLYAEGLQARRLERTPAAESRSLSGTKTRPGARQPGTARRLITPDLLIGGGLILALFVFVVWTAARVSSIGRGNTEATLPSVGEVLLITQTPTVDLTSSPTPVLESGTPAAVAPTAQPQSVVPAEAATATLAPINDDPLQVYIVTRQRAFLRVIVDGKISFNGRAVPGNAYPFSGKKSIQLISGNAAAFQIFFNRVELSGRPGRGYQSDLHSKRRGHSYTAAHRFAHPHGWDLRYNRAIAHPGDSHRYPFDSLIYW